MVEARVVTTARNQLGECPRWHAALQSLFWLDIPMQTLHRYYPATGQRTETPLDERVSAFAFRRGGGFLFAAGHQIARADEDGRILGVVATVDIATDARFNDGAADAAGRFWVGTLNTARRPDNRLYCFESGSLRVADSLIGASNGIAWGTDGRTMYLADSPRKTIFAYDFDIASGAATNRRVFVETADKPGVPDGITVDQHGGVWCAYWDGWRVVRYDAAGHATVSVRIPTPRPTACAFGGERLDILFVTSAREGIAQDDAYAGDLFAIETGMKGLAPFEAAI